MMDVVTIDGSSGEGGGQMVRSSLALSMVTGKSVTIKNVRANRDKPGLKQQHLTAVRAAQQISGAEVLGAAIGSAVLSFRPGPVVSGDYTFSVGTAGSATLVLQTVLPPLLIADGSSRLVIEGGTHNAWAPPYDFLERAFLPLINRMGPRVSVKLERAGFYPAGGGRFVVEIAPARHLNGFDLTERGNVRSQRGRVVLANLPAHIAEREIQELIRLTGWNRESFQHEDISSPGPGNAVLLYHENEHLTEVFSGIGEQRVRAEVISQRAFGEMQSYLKATAPVGPHLADQLLLPLAISAWQESDETRQRGGKFHATEWTLHSQTNMDVIKSFLDVGFLVQPLPDKKSEVSVAVVPREG